MKIVNFKLFHIGNNDQSVFDEPNGYDGPYEIEDLG